VIVLLDASASMNATDVSSSRFEEARRIVQDLVSGMTGASRVTLILVSQTPETLISAATDKALLRAALAGAEPSFGPADWQSAFALAAGAAHGSESLTTVIVSDGGLPESGLPALPGEVRFVPIGNADNNIAVTALALRASASGPQLFANVTNFSDADRSALLSIYIGEALITARQLNLAAGASESFTLDRLANTPAIYQAKISNVAEGADLDSLPLDDTAYAIYQASSARRVLLVSNGNLYLEQLLAALQNIQPFRALPGDDGPPQIPTDPFDLYILDGVIPEELPEGNLLIINPSSNPLLPVSAVFNDMQNLQVHESPLTRAVDWSNVHVLQAKKMQPPAWADVVIETQGGPLLLAGETDGRRIVVLTFDLRESDLPLQVAYPILFTNIINFLVPPSAFDATQSLRPGEILTIMPPPGTEQVVVALPSNEIFNLSPQNNVYTFAETNEPGYYAVNFISGDTTRSEYFAVNLFDPAESDIRPRENIQVGQAEITARASDQVGQREVWPWLAVVALIILMIEWQVYHRRPIPVRFGAKP
ncbi:MAG: VWA domain-containing protein, partial [Chloroflexota bacterium]